MSRDRFQDLHREKAAGPEHIRLISEGGHSLARSPRPICIDSIQVTQSCTTESQHIVYRSVTGACTMLSSPNHALFSFSLENAGDLDRGVLPAVLRARFEQQRMPLSDSACLSVQRPGRIWFLTDLGRRYSIRKLAAYLTVFREA